MKFFYGIDMESHLLYAPRFLITYNKFMHTPKEKFRIPEGVEWILDSGGFNLAVKGETYELEKDKNGNYIPRKNYERDWKPEVYARFINEWKPTFAFTMDYALFNSTPGTVREKQMKTNEKTIQIRDNLDDKRMIANVLQGRNLSEYLDHMDMMRESGTLTEYLAIGSIFKNPDYLAIIREIKKNAPGNTKLHGLGIKKTQIKKSPYILSALYSADSAVWFSMGPYTAPPGLRNAFLVEYIKEMESFLKEYENFTTISDIVEFEDE